jgi:hypothetical protein
MLWGVFFLKLRKFRLGVLLLAERGKGADLVLFGGNGFRVLPDHDLKIVQCFLIVSQMEMR